MPPAWLLHGDVGDGTEALYRGFGFEVRERWELLPGAPMARTLWRDPRRERAPAGLKSQD